MGDFADMAIQDGLMQELDDIYDNGYIDEPDLNNYSKPKSKNKVCKNCGLSGLHWQKAPTGWRLFDRNNKIHNCNKKFEKGGKRIVFTDKKKLSKPKAKETFSSSDGATYGDGDYIGIDY